ncbi:rod shape-determining protein MreC [bacterium]|nr:rod shape-determining protein MreC [bacterium]
MKRVLVPVIILCACIILLTVSHNYSQDNVRSVFLNLLYPFQKLTRSAYKSGVNLKKAILSVREMRSKEDALEKEIESLSIEIKLLRSLRTENKKLRELLEIKNKYNYQIIFAEIIAGDITSLYDSVIIDKGKKDNIEKNMPVMTAQGIVGITQDVGAYSTRIITILNPNCKLGVFVGRSSLRGVMQGKGDYCVIKYISIEENIEIGNRVYTSEGGGIYPEGIEVGKVFRIDKNPHDIFQVIYVLPCVNIRTLDKVAVIKDK